VHFFTVQRLVTVLLVFQDAGSQSATLVSTQFASQLVCPVALVVVPFVQAVQLVAVMLLAYDPCAHSGQFWPDRFIYLPELLTSKLLSAVVLAMSQTL
jgi:hypothetical protein